MTIVKASQVAKRIKKIPTVEEDIWVELPVDLLDKMRLGVVPEKWPQTETDLLQNYNRILNMHGEPAAMKYAVREAQAFNDVAEKKQKERLVDWGTKVTWGASALGRLLVDYLKH
jgi:hypothetical protein